MTTEHPIVAFLRARLDEDEQIARAAGGTWRYDRIPSTDGPDIHALQFDDQRVIVDIGFMEDDVMRLAEAQHIAFHDPARVLLEVEAKRRIVDRGSDWTSNEYEAWPVLAMLALAYADHPDYQSEEWKP